MVAYEGPTISERVEFPWAGQPWPRREMKRLVLWETVVDLIFLAIRVSEYSLSLTGINPS